MPSIIITGANGFIGSHLVSHFSRRGWRVIALVHHMPKTFTRDVLYVNYELEKGPDEGIFKGTDYLVHAAYVKQHDHPDSFRINTEGTTKLLEEARKFELKRIVFLSSLSARSDAESAYGRQKYQLQQLFNKKNELVVRPGLVIGNGGIFKGIYQYIEKKTFIPMVDGGHQPMHTIGVADLALAIDKALDLELSGTITVAEAEPVEMKTLYKEVAMTAGKNPTFIPLPYPIAMFLLSLMKLLGMKMTVGKENLKGLKKSRREDLKKDLEKLGMKISPYYESVARLKTALSP